MQDEYGITKHKLHSYNIESVRVLVVDGNWFMRTTVRSVLHAFSIRTTIDVGPLADAWMTYQSTQPDLVFIDWSPTYNGLSLLTRIRKDKECRNPFVPVIIMSSLTEPNQVLLARDAGMTEFIVNGGVKRGHWAEQ